MRNLIGVEVKELRRRYDEALQQHGIPAVYQFPNLATSNAQGEPEIDSYSEEIKTSIIFDGNPKAKTYKRYGWVVANSADLPFLIHCSFTLPHVQKDSLFRIGGIYSELPDRVFRVTEITTDLMAPDHIICQVVPEYENQTVRKTKVERSQQFNKSNTFLKSDTDYRGNVYTTQEDII